MLTLIGKATKAAAAVAGVVGLVWLPIAASGETIPDIINGFVWGFVALATAAILGIVSYFINERNV